MHSILFFHVGFQSQGSVLRQFWFCIVSLAFCLVLLVAPCCLAFPFLICVSRCLSASLPPTLTLVHLASSLDSHIDLQRKLYPLFTKNDNLGWDPSVCMCIQFYAYTTIRDGHRIVSCLHMCTVICIHMYNDILYKSAQGFGIVI